MPEELPTQDVAEEAIRPRARWVEPPGPGRNSAGRLPRPVIEKKPRPGTKKAEIHRLQAVLRNSLLVRIQESTKILSERLAAGMSVREATRRPDGRLLDADGLIRSRIKEIRERGLR